MGENQERNVRGKRLHCGDRIEGWSALDGKRASENGE